MQQNITIKKISIKTKVLALIIAIAASIALPQVFHLIGKASGLGASLGASLLPMHIPVILAGLFFGPLVGLIAGAFSPVLSYAISGMPAINLLPFMTIELAAYGLFGGLLTKTNIPCIVKLLALQVAGRLVRAIAVLIGIYVIGIEGLTLAATYNVVLTGLFGIVLQWVLIPLLDYRARGLFANNIKKNNENE